MADPPSENEKNALAAIEEADKMIKAIDGLAKWSDRWKRIQAAIGRISYD